MLKKTLATMVTVVFLITAAHPAVTATPNSFATYIDPSYGQMITETLTSFETWPGYGFRAAGSSAEHEAAEFLRTQMDAIGLSDVRLEEVPVDAWEFKGASLTVTQESISYTFDASSFGGANGTPPEGLTGEIVYVGRGAPYEYPEEGVEGKLLLVDWDADWFWVNLVGHQATVSGAKGVIISTMSHPSYYAHPNSLGSFDGTYNIEWVPLIQVSRNSGFQIMNMLANGPVQGCMKSDITITLAEEGGIGYNIVGILPGSDNSRQLVVLAHHDAWFFGASDDTSGVAGLMMWAKALADSGAVPKHDIVFVATTAEEYGNTNSYYEWLVGAWYMITREHPDWAEKTIAFFNIEGTGGDGGRFTARTNYQLAPLAREIFDSNTDLLPYGYRVFTTLSSWQDGWTLTAAGIPGITFGSSPAGFGAIYHTNFDVADLLDYEYMAQNVELMQKCLEAVDSAPILPYTFYERATNLAQSIDLKDYEYVGVDVSVLDDEISEFRALARKYDKTSSKLPVDKADEINPILMSLSHKINSQWTALSCWDSVIYPTQQVEWDCIWLTKALKSLKRGDLNGALDELWNVGLTWNAFYDYEVFAHENSRHDFGTEHLNWGEQGHLAPYVDIWHEYRSIQDKYKNDGKVTWEYDELAEVLASEILELENRIVQETQQVAEVNSLLATLLEMAA